MKDKILLKNFSIYFVRNVVTAVCPMVILAYCSRTLGVSVIGRVQYAQSIVSFFMLFSSVAVSGYGIREIAKRQGSTQRIKEFASELLTINLVEMLLSYIVLFSILLIVKDLREYFFLIIVLSIDLIGNVIGMDWLFRGLEKFYYISIRTILLQIISVLIMFLKIKNSTDIFAYVIILLIPTAGAGVWNFIHCCLKKQTGLCFSYKKLKKHFKPLIYTFGIAVTANLYLMLDTTMIGSILGDYEVGLYTAASKLLKLVVTLISALCSVFVPRLSYLYENGLKKDFSELLANTFNFIIGISIPGAMGICLLGKEIIMLFCGEEFINAVTTLQILSVDLIFASLSGFFAWQVLMPQNKEKIIFYTTFAGGIVDFVLNLIFIPQWGIKSAAISTICAEFIVSMLCIKGSMKYKEIIVLFKEIWKYIFATVIFIPIIYSIREKCNSDIEVFAFSCISCFVAYIGGLVILRSSYLKKLVNLLKKR